MITLEAAEQITRRCVLTLEEDFRARVLCWLRDLSTRTDIIAYIYCGARSRQEQARLYAQGRTAPGKIVTRARPGQSYHNYGLAIDWVPLIAHEKTKTLFIPGWSHTAKYKRAQALAAPHGLAPLSWELPHLQDARYKTWRDIPGAHLSA